MTTTMKTNLVQWNPEKPNTSVIYPIPEEFFQIFGPAIQRGLHLGLVVGTTVKEVIERPSPRTHIHLIRPGDFLKACTIGMSVIPKESVEVIYQEIES